MDQLMKLITDFEKMQEKIEKAEQGYEPRCKICNCSYQDEIEEMYEGAHSYREISDFLYSKGYSVSYMSLSRHFKKHYPKRKAYLENKKNMEDEIVQKAMEEYPILKRELEDEERSCATIFVNDRGYCLTGKHFCDNIPKKEVDYNAMERTEYEILEMNQFPGLYRYEKKLFKMIKCMRCGILENSAILDYLIHAFTKNVLDLDIEPEKFREMFWYDAEWDFKEMDKLLKQRKSNYRIPE